MRYTSKEICEAMQISLSTLSYWRKNGLQGAKERVNGYLQYRHTIEEIESYLGRSLYEIEQARFQTKAD